MWNDLRRAAPLAEQLLRDVRCPNHPDAAVEWVDVVRETGGRTVVLPRAVCAGGGHPHGLKLPWQDALLDRLSALSIPADMEFVVRSKRRPTVDALPLGASPIDRAEVPRLVLSRETWAGLEAYERRVAHGRRVHREYHVGRIVMLRTVGLLYGPPGTGKTSSFAWVTRGMASRWKVSLRALLRPHLGETEASLAELTGFLVARSREPEGAAVLLDDADDILGARGGDASAAGRAHDSLVVGLLDMLDRAEGLVVCVTTNRLTSLDPALLRRVSDPIAFPLPDADVRRTLLEGALETTGLCRRWPIDEASLSDVAARAEGLSAADITESIFRCAIELDAGVTQGLHASLIAALAQRRAFHAAFAGRL